MLSCKDPIWMMRTNKWSNCCCYWLGKTYIVVATWNLSKYRLSETVLGRRYLVPISFLLNRRAQKWNGQHFTDLCEPYLTVTRQFCIDINSLVTRSFSKYICLISSSLSVLSVYTYLLISPLWQICHQHEHLTQVSICGTRVFTGTTF